MTSITSIMNILFKMINKSYFLQSDNILGAILAGFFSAGMLKFLFPSLESFLWPFLIGSFLLLLFTLIYEERFTVSQIHIIFVSIILFFFLLSSVINNYFIFELFAQLIFLMIIFLCWPLFKESVSYVFISLVFLFSLYMAMKHSFCLFQSLYCYEGGYLTSAYAISNLSVIVLSYLSYKIFKGSRFSTQLVFVLFIYLFILFLLINHYSRGAFLFAILQLILTTLLLIYRSKNSAIIFSFFIFLSVLIILNIGIDDYFLFEKISRLFDYGSESRFDRITQTLAHYDLSTLLFGMGIGASEIIVENYPHNYILQIILDSGFIAFLFIYVPFFYMIIKLYLQSNIFNDFLAITIISISLNIFLYTMVSSSFYAGFQFCVIYALLTNTYFRVFK